MDIYEIHFLNNVSTITDVNGTTFTDNVLLDVVHCGVDSIPKHHVDNIIRSGYSEKIDCESIYYWDKCFTYMCKTVDIMCINLYFKHMSFEKIREYKINQLIR